LAADSVPIVQVIGYGPAGLDGTAVVEQVAEPETTDAESPATKPVMVVVKVGFGCPNRRVLLSAVAGSGGFAAVADVVVVLWPPANGALSLMVVVIVNVPLVA